MTAKEFEKFIKLSPEYSSFVSKVKVIHSNLRSIGGDRPEYILVGIDPGITNLAASFILVRSTEKPIPLGFVTWDVSQNKGRLLPEALAAVTQDIKQIIRYYTAEAYYSWPSLSAACPQVRWVIEYQPPINVKQNPALIRNNTYVEAYLSAVAGSELAIVMPASVKVWLLGCKAPSTYRSNKQLAIASIKEIYPSIDMGKEDHWCDGLLNSMFWYFKSVKGLDTLAQTKMIWDLKDIAALNPKDKDEEEEDDTEMPPYKLPKFSFYTKSPEQTVKELTTDQPCVPMQECDPPTSKSDKFRFPAPKGPVPSSFLWTAEGLKFQRPLESVPAPAAAVPQETSRRSTRQSQLKF